MSDFCHRKMTELDFEDQLLSDNWYMIFVELKEYWKRRQQGNFNRIEIKNPFSLQQTERYSNSIKDPLNQKL